MGKELFEKRKQEFINTVHKLKTLPRIKQAIFEDREDQRLWFNKTYKSQKFPSFNQEIDSILKQYNVTILTDLEKEQEFITRISNIGRIPNRYEYYFSDNDEMHSWYLSYINHEPNFETIVHNMIPEYQELDLSTMWPHVKEEFEYIIFNLKRIPNHNKYKLQNGIDVRVIYDKLETYDPEYIEILLLKLQNYNKKGLSQEERINELLQTVTILEYIPTLQETRFTDGTDMFTWYMLNKDNIPNLEQEVLSKIKKDNPNKQVNIYLIPNFRKTGGKFYTICSNVGEVLDLSEVNSFEEAKQLDNTLVKRGGVILKKDEEIGSVNFTGGKRKK